MPRYSEHLIGDVFADRGLLSLNERRAWWQRSAEDRADFDERNLAPGWKLTWLAFETTELRALFRALDASRIERLDWTEDARPLDQSCRFPVIGPHGGFTFLLGGPSVGTDKPGALLQQLDEPMKAASSWIGTVRFFRSQRTSGSFAWATWSEGRMIEAVVEMEGGVECRGSFTPDDLPESSSGFRGLSEGAVFERADTLGCNPQSIPPRRPVETNLPIWFVDLPYWRRAE
jgi:hypothetical protein